MVPSLLKHLAGRRRPKRPAVIVHGVLANVDLMAPFARALVRYGGFDGVFGYDSWSYWGATNRGWQLKTVDLLEIVQPGVRGMILGLRRPVARRAALLLQTGAYVVEGAGQDIAALVHLLPWRNVCLIGHCLGGLVVRCAVEAHSVGHRVGSVITMGTAHSLWLDYRPPMDWSGQPNPRVRYLGLVGEHDWFRSDLSFGDFSADDESHEHLFKVLYPGTDRWSIHRQAHKTWVPELISACHFQHGFRRRDESYVVYAKPLSRLHLVECSGSPPRRARAASRYPGTWLEFWPEEPIGR